MDSSFCVEALEEALCRYDRPEIFNTDQGSQFTSDEFTGVVKDKGMEKLNSRPRKCLGFKTPNQVLFNTA